MASQALVLNASYEPIRIVSWEKAIQLMFQGKVEVLQESESEVRSVRITIKIPAVLRLLKYVPMGRKHRLVRFSRANVFIRDNHTCQYCGRKYSRFHLTLDHIVPVVRGGPKTWENIVTCCKNCNQKKGGQTPQEASMKLIRKPVEPKWLPKNEFSIGIKFVPEKWLPYLKIEIGSSDEDSS